MSDDVTNDDSAPNDAEVLDSAVSEELITESDETETVDHVMATESVVVAEDLDTDSAADAAAPGDSDTPEPTAAAGSAQSEDAAEEDEGEELVDEGEVAADYLEGLLDIADLDGDIDITVENDRAALSIIEVNTGDLQHLVGRDGKVLSALQDLTRLAVTRETGQRSRLMLDIAGHRATRRSELQRIAQQAITEAKETGEAVRMAAMSAFERKVVHDEVAAAGMSSESEGSDPNRYVVITPA